MRAILTRFRQCSLHVLGLVYMVCIVGLHLYVWAGPAFQNELAARPEHAAHVLARVAMLVAGGFLRPAVFVGLFAALLAGYGTGLSKLERQASSRYGLFAWATIFVILLLPLSPHFSLDIVGYAQHGRVLAAHHESPYLHTLAEHPNDPIFYPGYKKIWSSQKNPYGPVLTLLLAGASWLGGNSLVLTIGLLKLMMAMCYLLSGWLLGQIVDRVQPQATLRSLFFFLWNPLVLFELVGQGHNDAVMIVLMVAGLYFVAREGQVAGFSFLLLSTLCKYVTAPLLPIHAALLLRRRSFPAIGGAVAFTFLALLGSYLVFFRPPGALAGLREVGQLPWLTPTWLGVEMLKRGGGWETDRALMAIRIPLLLVFGLFLFWRMAKVTTERHLLRESTLVMACFFLAVANQNNPWYYTLLVALTAITLSPLMRSLVFVVSAWPLVCYFPLSPTTPRLEPIWCAWPSSTPRF